MDPNVDQSEQTEVVTDEEIEAQRKLDNFNKNNISPYPRHIRRMESKTRASRKAKQRAKQSYSTS